MLFQKKSIPTPRMVIGNSWGEGGLKVKILEAKYEDKLEFPGGRGAEQTTSIRGQYGYFRELHNINWEFFSVFRSLLPSARRVDLCRTFLSETVILYPTKT